MKAACAGLAIIFMGIGAPGCDSGDGETCAADCAGRECGDDGCGGSCGECTVGNCNTDGQCRHTCQPDCTGRECGDDGCGGSCGDCATGTCDAAGQCQSVCAPDCIGRECGDDGCGGSCGDCMIGTCDGQGVCQTTCEPACGNRECGDDGCGGSCGECSVGTCDADGQCRHTCQADCEGKVCGDDGCGGSCGSCNPPETCDAGQCGCEEPFPASYASGSWQGNLDDATDVSGPTLLPLSTLANSFYVATFPQTPLTPPEGCLSPNSTTGACTLTPAVPAACTPSVTVTEASTGCRSTIEISLLEEGQTSTSCFAWLSNLPVQGFSLSCPAGDAAIVRQGSLCSPGSNLNIPMTGSWTIDIVP